MRLVTSLGGGGASAKLSCFAQFMAEGKEHNSRTANLDQIIHPNFGLRARLTNLMILLTRAPA